MSSLFLHDNYIKSLTLLSNQKISIWKHTTNVLVFYFFSILIFYDEESEREREEKRDKLYMVIKCILLVKGIAFKLFGDSFFNINFIILMHSIKFLD